MTSNRFIYWILAAFIAGTLLIIFMQYNSAKNIHNLITGNKRLLSELKAGNQLREAERDLLSIEIKMNRAVATGDTTKMKEVDELFTETGRLLDSLRAVDVDDSAKRNIDRLMGFANEKARLEALILDSFRRTGRLSTGSYRVISDRRRLANEVNVASRNIYDNRQRLLDSLSTFTNKSGREAQRWSAVMILMTLVSEAVLFWYIISRIRHQNQLIRQLDASEKNLREASRIKENFMANISHEIRTPMNAIVGFTDLLKARNRDPEMTEFIDAIRQSGENLLILINDLLDRSKIEAGMMRIESAPFHIRELIHSVETMFAEKMVEKGLRFSVVIDESLPDELRGDPTRLTQILANMIGNALKFTAEGGVGVEVNNQGQDAEVVRIGFFIRDTGIGIPREKLSQIFERFQQAEDSITRKYGGTGLGLSIVKDLVLLQHGDITVDSEPGKGTVFRFTLPYRLETGQPAAPVSPEEAGSSYPDRHDIHILVAEDNKVNQRLLRHLLTAWKLSFDIVNNGAEAIERLRTGRYDLVLMDVQMPEMDGYTAARQIRADLKLDVPIIAMTAHAFPGEREKSLDYGMNEYIAKPIKQQELLRLIDRFTPLTYRLIDLGYMRSISEGNREYEKSVTAQFITDIPIDLEKLGSAQLAGDQASIRQTAHSMRSNVAIMGLLERLEPYLDVLEYEPFQAEKFQRMLSAVKTICEEAMPEARHFYAGF